jgi:hypothetical protein
MFKNGRFLRISEQDCGKLVLLQWASPAYIVSETTDSFDKLQRGFAVSTGTPCTGSYGQIVAENGAKTALAVSQGKRRLKPDA